MTNNNPTPFCPKKISNLFRLSLFHCYYICLLFRLNASEMVVGGGYYVKGYVVRYCTDEGHCNHDSITCIDCPNPTDTVYYVNPNEQLENLVGKPLIVTHNENFVIGHCLTEAKSPKGIFIVCQIDDAYYLESIRRRFKEHRERYNKDLQSFETYLKKTLSSFSLSHSPKEKTVKHIALVDTPGRKGTAVDYIPNTSVVLKRRPNNLHISDIIASHSTAYLPVSDRKEYLIANARLSYNQNDTVYINANRKLADEIEMNNLQSEFNDAVEIQRIMKYNRSKNNLKRQRQSEDDLLDGPSASFTDEQLERLIEERQRKKAKTAISMEDRESDGECIPTPKRQMSNINENSAEVNPVFVQAMRDVMKEGFANIAETFKGIYGMNAPPQKQPTTVDQQVPGSVTHEPVVEQMEESNPPIVRPQPISSLTVDAARPTALTINSLDRPMLDMIVNKIMGI